MLPWRSKVPTIPYRAGYKPCMMPARTKESTVMQGAGLSVSKWLDHCGFEMRLGFLKSLHHTRYYCTAWLIMYVNWNLAWCLRERKSPRSSKGHEMSYYILKVVEKELLASLHLSGVSTCTFQGRKEEPSPHILVDWLHSCSFGFGISVQHICSVGSSS